MGPDTAALLMEVSQKFAQLAELAKEGKQDFEVVAAYKIVRKDEVANSPRVEMLSAASSMSLSNMDASVTEVLTTSKDTRVFQVCPRRRRLPVSLVLRSCILPQRWSRALPRGGAARCCLWILLIALLWVDCPPVCSVSYCPPLMRPYNTEHYTLTHTSPHSSDTKFEKTVFVWDRWDSIQVTGEMTSLRVPSEQQDFLCQKQHILKSDVLGLRLISSPLWHCLPAPDRGRGGRAVNH